ncbi:hypothetical protein K2X85_19985 [bacterium]|nr:hypothetical protein [bacterium]
MFLAVTLAAIGVGYVVRRSYLGVPGVHDDHFFEWLVGERWLGRLTWSESMTASHSGQLVPLGLEIYGRLIAWFGIESSAFSIFALLAHAFSAGMLVVLLRRPLGVLGAAVAGLLWAGVAIGRWDNTLLWRANVVLVWVPFTWLFSLWCLDVFHRSAHRRWLSLAVIAACLLVAQWNASVLFLPSLVLAYVTRSRGNSNKGIYAREMIAWIGLCLLGIVAAWIGLRWAKQGVPTAMASPGEWLAMGWVVPSFFAVGLADATFWSATQWATKDLVEKSLVLTGFLMLMLLTPRRAWATLSVMVGTGLLYATAVVVLRADLGADVILTSGRYFSIPLLVLCVASGGIVAGIDERLQSPRARRFFIAGGLIALLGYFVHQHSVAQEARRQFDSLWADSLKISRSHRELVHALARRADPDEPLLVPDLPLNIPPVARPFPLSTLAVILGQETSARLRVKPIVELTPTELRQVSRRLGEIDSPLAREWQALIRATKEDSRAITWMVKWSASTGSRLPTDLVKRDGPREYPMSAWAEVLLGKQADSLDWNGSTEERMTLLSRLKNESGPEARFWVDLLTQAPTTH